MRPFHDCAIHVGVPAHVELNAFTLQHVLKRSVRGLLSPIRLHRDQTPTYGFRAFSLIENRLKRCRDRESCLRFQRHDVKVFRKDVYDTL